MRDASGELQLFHQLPNAHFKRHRNLYKANDGHVSNTSLDAGYVGPMEVGALGQLLLS